MSPLVVNDLPMDKSCQRHVDFRLFLERVKSIDKKRTNRQAKFEQVSALWHRIGSFTRILDIETVQQEMDFFFYPTI